MSKLAKVYAQSLFDIALEEKKEKDILEQIEVLKTAFLENASFLKVLSAPMIAKNEKVKLVDDIFKGKVDTVLLNYLKVVVNRQDAKCILDSFSDYEDIYNEHNNIEKVTATTAIALSDALKEKLSTRLTKLLNKTIILNNVVKEDCIGGVSLDFKNSQTDGTVLSQLKELKRQLLTLDF